LKILPEEYVENQLLSTLFQKEFKNLAQLDHPNIIKILHAGQFQKRWYFVMDWVDGIDMKKYITRNGKIEQSFILPIFKQIAHALHFAHEKGIVHRDIKSSNILLKQNGSAIKAYLTDFGISKDIGGNRTKVTMTGGVLGTADYIPPEQALGQRELIGPRSDIYSLGIVLYEMLCGRVPFRGETETAVIQMHLNQTPPNPRNFNNQISDATARVVLKAIAKDSGKRYSHTGEFYQALKLSFEGNTERNSATPPPLPRKDKTPLPLVKTDVFETPWLYPVSFIISVLLGVLMYFLGQSSQQFLQ
jgi:serine/threonine-protein kinase